MAELNLIEQAASLLATVRKSIADGKILADKAVVEARAAVCLSCDKLREKRGKYSCVTCGCSFKTKLASHGASCPLKKW